MEFHLPFFILSRRMAISGISSPAKFAAIHTLPIFFIHLVTTIISAGAGGFDAARIFGGRAFADG